LKKKVNSALLEMHGFASKHDDAQMTDFLEGNFLKEQVEAIKHLSDLITKMKRAGDGIGVHIIDKELQS
jgi:ferritin heavy chain